ncbi:hypothetical protein LEP1GSC072_1704 [Leptospira noguchii str. Bonito]|nr:hypothetical protein LEP1GSC072_1704 [Leptospira noguchii str. Bonito]
MGTITNLNFTVQFSKFGKDYKPSVEFSSKKKLYISNKRISTKLIVLTLRMNS